MLPEDGQVEVPKVKVNKNGKLIVAYLCLCTHADVKRTANIEPYSMFTKTKMSYRLQTNETEKKLHK